MKTYKHHLTQKELRSLCEKNNWRIDTRKYDNEAATGWTSTGAMTMSCAP